MTQSARVVAQAKINLLLRILAREASGYHSLETVFLRLDLGDDVRVRLTTGRSLDCTGPALPADGLGPTERNLAFRAADAYANAVGWPSGFAVEITKRIPVGGGLGGGSADAGAVLRALDAMSPKPLGNELPMLAADLGSDVPFLTTEHAMALAWSRGERMLALPPLESRPTVLAIPPISIRTAEAYGWLAQDRAGYSPEPLAHRLADFASWERAVAAARNDFQPVVAKRRPQIAELVDELAAAGAELSMLSGSGSTVFGVFHQVPDAAQITRSSGCTTLVTSTSNRVVSVELDE
jgi:4-diphosphocytidyl-2-C-methyl-D-erythritol kinase